MKPKFCILQRFHNYCCTDDVDMSFLRKCAWLFLVCFLMMSCDQDGSSVSSKMDIQLLSVIPGEGDVNIALKGVLQLTFGETPRLSSIATNQANGGCTGNVQLTDDDFQTCLGLESAGLMTDGQTVRIPYQVESGISYKVKVKAGILTENGGKLGTDYSTETGFTTADNSTCSQIPKERLMVAIVFGQSNSTDSTPGRTTLKQNTYMMDANGFCSLASDPMSYKPVLDLGSVWSRLGPKLVSEGLYDNVLFISIGVGGTSVSLWVPGAEFNYRIAEAIDLLENTGFSITHFLWHQGESDRLATTAEYESNFGLMLGTIRSRHPQVPVFVSIASRCGGDPYPHIQQAQINLVDPGNYVYQGPNSDTLDFSYRYDGCHFHEGGLEAHADLWMGVLQ
jgi:carbohydrate esterase-like sialic acid-specific acetylesterase